MTSDFTADTFSYQVSVKSPTPIVKIEKGALVACAVRAVEINDFHVTNTVAGTSNVVVNLDVETDNANAGGGATRTFSWCYAGVRTPDHVFELDPALHTPELFTDVPIHRFIRVSITMKVVQDLTALKDALASAADSILSNVPTVGGVLAKGARAGFGFIPDTPEWVFFSQSWRFDIGAPGANAPSYGTFEFRAKNPALGKPFGSVVSLELFP